MEYNEGPVSKGSSMIEKFSFDILLKKKRKRLVLVKSEGELREHVVMKLISYLYFYTPGLQIEMDAGMHYKPDVVMLGAGGNPEIWIDCGYISVVKAESLARKLRRTKIVIVKQSMAEIRQFRALLERRGVDVERIVFLGFENSFIASVAEGLDRKNDVTLYPVIDDVWGLAVNDRIFESRFFLIPSSDPSH